MNTRPYRALSWIGALFVLAAFRPITLGEGADNRRATRLPFVWLGETSPVPTESDAIQSLKPFAAGSEAKAAAAGMESFLRAHPDSPWAPSVRSHLGATYRQMGRYSLALEQWQHAWETTKGGVDPASREVADFALAHWTRLLASLGRYETLQAVFAETRGRTLSSYGLHQKFLATQEGFAMMRVQPGISYRCGTLALHHAARTFLEKNYARAAAADLLKQPSPATGFSLHQLEKLAEKHQLGFIPVKWDGKGLVVPSVVHWRENHYAAIVERRGESYRVVDPTFETQVWMDRETLQAEASGYFLVPQALRPPEWQRVAADEAGQVFGKGFPYELQDKDDTTLCPTSAGQAGGCCGVEDGKGPGAAGSVGSPGVGIGGRGLSGIGFGASSIRGVGMPVWRVSEPYVNLWIHDEPLGYQPTKGERISLQLSYCQRNQADEATEVFGFGGGWDVSWRSFLSDTYSAASGTGQAFLHPGGGGLFEFDLNGQGIATNYHYPGTLVSSTNGSGVTNYTLTFPDGRKEVFDVRRASPKQMFLSATITPEGQITRFEYDTNALADNIVRLLRVIDGDGRTNTLAYSTNTTGNLVTSVTDPYGRSASFVYGTNGASPELLLTNITDVASISSSLVYDADYWITKLQTPYGSQEFAFRTTTVLGTSGIPTDASRAVIATDPLGAKEMYMYQAVEGGHESAPPAVIPAGTPIGTLDTDSLSTRESWYWSKLQYPTLNTNFLASQDPEHLVTADFIKGRLRHWLGEASSGVHGNPDTLSVERAASPDGTTNGQYTFYDYEGKTPDPGFKGTSILPAVIARVQPEGDTWYTWYRRNAVGNVTNEVSTYTKPDGSVGTRTNIFVYDSTGRYLLIHTNALMVQVVSNQYNANGQIELTFNALNELTRFTYNTNQLLTSISYPSGLLTTNEYFSSGSIGHLERTRDYVVSGGSTTWLRTNSFTYTNGLILTHTDERGLTITNSWDALQRLVGRVYPDGSSISNRYADASRPLDISASKDRGSNWSSFVYSPTRQLLFTTNAQGTVTSYTYCDCGSLSSITNDLGTGRIQAVTSFTYDKQGNRLSRALPLGYTEYYSYDPLRRSKISHIGKYVETNFFNNQSLITLVSNVHGRQMAASYDILDRVTSMTDRSGLTVNTTYDNLGRVRTREHPDGAVEAYGYTANIAGPTSYTNQITNVVLYAYDAFGRKTNEVYVGLSTNSFAYSAASDLLSLVDGRGKQTSWVYDSYGRQIQKKDHTGTTILTNGYNPEGQLIARWSLQKGLTSYAYDTVGNATNVNYPASADLSLAYDRLGRLTNMVDAAGQSTLAYNSGGLLLSEDGPWERDTASLSYYEGLLTKIAIQQPGTRDWVVSYGTDLFRRSSSVTSPAGLFSLGHQEAMGGTNTPSALVRSVTYPNGVVQTNAFDARGRLLVSHLRNASGVLLNRHDYSYDPAGHRTNQVRWDGSDVGYAYDSMGQLTGAVGRHGSTNRIHEQFTYSYDAGGNLTTRVNNDLKEWFTVDNLNQLTEVLRTNLMTVAGTTSTNASSVAINGSTAGVNLYADATFAKAGLSLSNGTNTFTAVAQDALGRSDTNSVSVWMPTTRALGYDNNGNLISDGLRGFEYDDENQLIRITVTNAWMTEFVYDGMLRCRVRREKTWVSGAWQTASETRYVYHGRLVMQERDGNNQPRVTYTRGPDLSGTLSGAGGIGGLLARTENPPLLAGRTNSHTFYHADAGGNITAMTDSTQNVVARYLYDPYGNPISHSGPLAEVNVYRFSSKELHPASGLYSYGFRFYDPNLQRWPNRDPLGSPMVRPGSTGVLDNEFFPFEFSNGGNLYHYVYNNPINQIDPLGLDLWIVRDTCSTFGHEWVVGENGDGTYWDSNKMPGKGPLAPANCPADIDFNGKSDFDPKNLTDPCYQVTRHVVTSPAVNKKARDEAKKRADEDKGRYDALANNCRHYANSICDYSLGAKIREMIENRKKNRRK